MTAQLSWQRIVGDLFEGAKRNLYSVATGKAPPGTIEREIADETARKWLEAVKKQRTLTPQEEAEAQLDIQKKIASFPTDENLRSIQGVLPSALAAYTGRLGADDRSFGDRTRVNTDSAIRLGAANTSQQGALLDRNYGSWSENALMPIVGLQRDLAGDANQLRRDLGGRMLGIVERNNDAYIDLQRQAMESERRRNSGLQGFLQNVLAPVAQIGIAAKVLSS